jgi:hypothetical protein
MLSCTENCLDMSPFRMTSGLGKLLSRSNQHDCCSIIATAFAGALLGRPQLFRCVLHNLQFEVPSTMLYPGAVFCASYSLLPYLPVLSWRLFSAYAPSSLIVRRVRSIDAESCSGLIIHITKATLD